MRALAAFFVFLVASLPMNVWAAGKGEIALEEIRRMFATMRSKTDWNVDGKLLWSYYFVDSDQQKLNSLASHLAKDGYRVAGILPRNDTLLSLVVEKVERHTPESLNARNTDFYRLAEKFHIASYDGMDVAPAP